MNKQKTTLIVSIFIAFIAGYFIGREHVKYEISKAFTDAGNAFSESMSNAFSGTSTKASEKTKAVKLVVGDEFEFDNRKLVLDEVVVNTISIRPSMSFDNKTNESDEDYLIFKFSLYNQDERKLLECYGADDHFKLEDDVENRVRVVTAGMDRIIGELGYQEIKPMENTTFIVPFEMPLPKTEAVTLTVNLRSFSGEGTIEYTIPVSDIKGFQGN